MLAKSFNIISGDKGQLDDNFQEDPSPQASGERSKQREAAGREEMEQGREKESRRKRGGRGRQRRDRNLLEGA